MLKLNPAATVDVVADFNQLLDPERAAACEALRKNRERLFRSAAQLRADPDSKRAHRAYLNAAQACDISPKTLDAYFGLTHAGGVKRRRLGLAGPKGQKFAIAGAPGAALLLEVFGKYADAPAPKQRPRTAPVVRDTASPAPAAAAQGLVIRIDGYPHLYITTCSGDLTVVLNALKGI